MLEKCHSFLIEQYFFLRTKLEVKEFLNRDKLPLFLPLLSQGGPSMTIPVIEIAGATFTLLP